MTQAVVDPWWRGVSRYQWTVLIIAWLGWLFDIVDTALFNFAKGPLLTELLGGAGAYKLRGAEVESKILFVFLIGWSVGGLVFGWVADKFGRTRTLIWTILIYALFTGLTVFCKSWEQVAVVRFVTAIGIGGEWAAGAALVAEAFPDKARAPAAALLQSAAAFGPMFAAIANLNVAAADWRVLFLIGVFPALLTVFVRRYIREPEAWVRNKGQGADPLRSLLKSRMYSTRAIIALMLGVAGIASATNLSFWMPNLVQEIGLKEGLDANGVQHWKSFVTFAMHAGTLGGVLLMPIFCERMGRRGAFALFFAMGAIVMSVPLLLSLSLVSLLILMPMASLFVIGLSAGFVLYFPELFPASLRATGAGIAYNVGRVVSALVPVQSARIMATQGVGAGIAITAIGLSAIGAIVATIAPETRGKSLPAD